MRPYRRAPTDVHDDEIAIVARQLADLVEAGRETAALDQLAQYTPTVAMAVLAQAIGWLANTARHRLVLALLDASRGSPVPPAAPAEDDPPLLPLLELRAGRPGPSLAR